MVLINVKLEHLFDYLTAIVQSPVLTWQEKYNQVFSAHCAHRINELFHEAGLQFNYYDPDADYEDDVMAYYRAVTSEMPRIRALALVAQARSIASAEHA